MSIIPKVNFCDFLELEKEILNPFNRLIHIRKINENFGKGRYHWYDMGNGIAVLIKSFIPNQDITLIEQSGGVAGATFIFNLGEDINYSFINQKNLTLKNKDFFLELISDSFHAQNHLNKGKKYLSLMIAIKEELFLEFASSIKDIKDFMKEAHKDTRYNIYNGNIDFEQFEIINSLNDCYFNEDLINNIFLEAKSTNLFYYTISKIANSLNGLNKKYNNSRIANLKRAKEIIISEYNQNLSIKDIAYKSAINECYLKKEFKEFYGMTILEMLQKRRLEVAKELLKDDFNVNEVALKVGYKHSGHFSKLFFEYFNISPSSYKKQFSI